MGVERNCFASGPSQTICRDLQILGFGFLPPGLFEIQCYFSYKVDEDVLFTLHEFVEAELGRFLPHRAQGHLCNSTAVYLCYIMLMFEQLSGSPKKEAW